MAQHGPERPRTAGTAVVRHSERTLKGFACSTEAAQRPFACFVSFCGLSSSGSSGGGRYHLTRTPGPSSLGIFAPGCFAPCHPCNAWSQSASPASALPVADDGPSSARAVATAKKRPRAGSPCHGRRSPRSSPPSWPRSLERGAFAPGDSHPTARRRAYCGRRRPVVGPSASRWR
jgi:hypothetical protein